jgi:outer membrane lipopolysaccharide assembly protein LptE/RlpB
MPNAATCPPQSGRRLALAVVLTLVAGLILPACTHYRLGTGAELTFRSLYVAPVASETLLPQARALVGTRLREAFLRDGRVALVNSAEAAEATLHVSLKSYSREASVARADDTGLARKFALTLTAECTLRTREGKVVFEKRAVQVQRDAYTDQGQLQAEYQTLPLLAETLAQNVTHAVLDVW